MHSPSTLLRVLAALTVLAAGVACEEEPEPAPPSSGLRAVPAARRLNINASTDITTRSRNADGSDGTGDVTATIAQAGQAFGSIVVKDGPAGTESTTASASPEDGQAVFTFQCIAAGDAVIDFKDSNGDASVTIVCEDAARTVLINSSDCDNKLQADGVSSCEVKVSINEAPANTTIKVRLGDVTDAAGVAVEDDTLEPFSATAGGPAARELTITLDGEDASFFVNSRKAGDELTLEVIVTDNATNTARKDIAIKASTGAPSVTVTAPVAVTEGRTGEFTVTAKNPNGTFASIPLQLEVTGGTLVDGGCVTDGEALLDPVSGLCAFSVTAGTLVENPGAQLKVKAILALSNIAPKEAEATATIKALGSLNVIATASRPVILPRNATALPGSFATEEVVVTVKMEKENALLDSSATVSVRQASRSLLRLIKRNDETLTGDETAAFTITDAPGGEFTFTVESPNANALGSGTIEIAVTDAGANPVQPPTIVTVTLTIERQRRLSTLLFVSNTPEVIGVSGSPTTNQSTARFELRDETGAKVGGELIRFETATTADGVFVSPNGTTNLDGLVDAQVTAGTQATPITIIATVESRPDLRTSSLPIAVIGGQPNSAYSSFRCTAKAVFDPFTTTCVAALSDHFTNVVGAPQRVQFRAEGGNVIPEANSDDAGLATTTFSFSEPGPGSADVLQWSHARSSPATASSNTALVAAFPGCFDRTSRTPCDLLGICESTNPSIAGHCPLIASTRVDAGLCAADIRPEALEALELGGSTATAAQFDEDIFTFFDGTALDQYETYLDDFRACGLPLSCLTGDTPDGILFDGGDDCPVNAGCLDFNGATECPQNGLLTMMASVRGEEGFDDVDGDGLRDDGSRGPNNEFLGVFESFIDFPEPFLDMNSSCSYDDLNHLSSNGTPRGRLPPSEVIRLSDQFIDSGDRTFGTIDPVTRERVETNGKHDTNTDIFMTTSVVHLSGGRRLQFGEAINPNQCGADGRAIATCRSPETGSTRGATSSCTETALSHVGDNAILESCTTDPEEFRDGDIVNFVYRWTDANGNCPTPDFAGLIGVTVDGVAEVVATASKYDSALCGALPGAINASNVDRPWCEEHPDLGSRTLPLSVRATCESETKTQVVKLTFTLDDVSVSRTLLVGCPECGDDRLEGTEECDDGNTEDGDGCDATCVREVEE